MVAIELFVYVSIVVKANLNLHNFQLQAKRLGKNIENKKVKVGDISKRI